MKKKFYGFRKWEQPYGGTIVFVMSAFFLFGAILGSFISTAVLKEGGGMLYEKLTGYLLRYAGEYLRPTFFSSFISNFRLPLLIFIFSLTGYGVFLIPVSLMLRGLMLSAVVTGFIRLYGINGAFLSLAAFGIQNVLAIPALIILSTQAYSFAGVHYDKIRSVGRRALEALPAEEYLKLCGVLSVVLFFCVFTELFISPVLITYIHNFL
ncbi:MAG: stage II sporulation protein M [Bacillota bacterium]|nr:stage II sporulation protein M [Bacillota bacterium]